MDDLLQQGITAFRAGKREEARKIFAMVVKQNPENDRAWGWMYDVSNNDNERAYCLRQMLRINPNNKKASQLYKQLTTSKQTSSSSGVALKPVIFISVVLVCLVGICSIGFLFIDSDVVTSTSTIEAPIPIETIIGLTYSAARTQTAMVSSLVPLSTLTLAPPIENIPTATIFIFQLQTNVAQPTEYIYSTNTPFSLTTQLPPAQSTSTVQSTLPPQSAVCSCSGNTLNCGDFSTHSQAQACYNYCVSLGRGDVHDLDGDKNGIACESLP